MGEDGRSVILISLFLKSRTKFSAPTLSGCKKLFWSQGPLLPRVRGLPALKSLSDTKGSYQNDKHKSFLPIFILIVSRFCHALFHYANIQSLFPDIEKSYSANLLPTIHYHQMKKLLKHLNLFARICHQTFN